MSIKSSRHALAQPMPISKNVTTPVPTIDRNDYYHQRLAQLGISTQQAKEHGLAVDDQGAIRQYCRAYTGEIRVFAPQFGKLAQRRKRIKNRKTFTNIGLEQFDRALYITRHTPQQLATDPHKARYQLWSKKYTGVATLPLPNNLAISHYKNGVTGGTISFTEGYFKAIAAAINGIEMSSFSGNTHFKFDAIVQDYITRRQPDNIVLLLDGDARDLHGKKEKLSSNRIQGFHNGMYKFAEAFFDWCQRQGLKYKLHIAIIQPDQPKGFDDLLHAATPEQQTAIVDAYQSLRTSNFFEFTALSRTTFRPKLQQLFYLKNHQDFYEHFAEQLGLQPFRFNGFTYQCLDLFPNRQQLSLLPQQPLKLDKRPPFQLLNDPFKIDIPTTPLTITKYVDEQQTAIKQVVQQHHQIAFESATGSGKTTFFIEHCQQQGHKVVITVHTVNLARQLACKHNLHILTGSVNPKKKVAALNARIVVCTYDTLHHLDDLASRWLIVDEAHNLVNHFGEVRHRYVPFRANTLRTVVERFGKAKKVILLSGTMNRALCLALDFHLVKIQRMTNHQIEVYQIEASSQREQTALLIDQLQKVDFTSDKIHFGYYNSNRQLQLIKKQLVNSGKLTAADITIITRDEVKAGNHQVFDEIIKHECIKSPVKLILSSCLIAEGINIKNKNIGKVFTVGVRCLDSFRQYVARFRAMKQLEVISITPPERKLQPAFIPPASLELTSKLRYAELQRQLYDHSRQQIIASFDPDELEFMPDILANYQVNGQLLPLIYERDGQAYVDVLRILALIRERQLDTSNNCYFFSRLRQYPEFKVRERRSITASSHSKQALKLQQEQINTYKKTTLAQLKSDLLAQPELPIHAYYLKVQHTQNRHARQFIQQLAPEVIQLPVAGATEYWEERQVEFTQSWYTQLIRDYLRMHFAGMDKITIEEELTDYHPREFAKKWQAFQTTAELLCYENKRHRKCLSPLHRLELKFLNRIKKKVHKQTEIGTVSSTLLHTEINGMLQRHRYNYDLEHPVVQQFNQLSTQEIDRNICRLFAVEQNTFANHCEYNIMVDYVVAIATKRHIENVPFCQHDLPLLLQQPLRVLSLYGVRKRE